MDNEKVDFNNLVPALRPCEIIVGENQIIIEPKGTREELILPKEYGKVIDLLNGHQSIQEIVATLYVDYGEISFNSVITAIRLLDENNLLDGVEGRLDCLEKFSEVKERKESLLDRTLFEKEIFHKIVMKSKQVVIYYAIIAVVLITVRLSFSKFHNFWDFNYSSFLHVNGEYFLSIFVLFLITTVLVSLKSIVKFFMLLTSCGSIYGGKLKLNLYSLSFRVNENSIYAQNDKKILITYSITSMLLYVFFAILSFIVFGKGELSQNITLVALVLTFIDSDPYHKSEVVKIFQFFNSQKQLKNMMPYFRNNSISSMFKKSEDIHTEIRLIIYSIYTMAWIMGFSLFSIELIVNNIPSLIFEYQKGSFVAMIFATIILLFLVLIFGLLSFEIFSTIFKNVYGFIHTPLAKVFRRSKSYTKKVYSNDEILKAFLKNNILGQLSEDVKKAIIEGARVVKVKKGKMLIVQGEVGKEMFYTLSGRVSISVRDKYGLENNIVDLGSYSLLGETAILEKCTRTASVKAQEESYFLEIPGELFDRLLESEFYKEDLQKLIMRFEISKFVSSAPLFKQFPPEMMNLFVESGDLVIFPKDHNVVEQGERDTTFYLLIKGQVEVIKNRQIVAQLGQGDFFGEIALLADTARTATIKTKEECLFLYIEGKDFWKILSANIEIAMYIENLAMQRMELQGG